MTDYIDRQIADLQDKMDALYAERAKLVRDNATLPQKSFTVELDENNSGGSYWLRRADYNALVQLGWSLDTGSYGPGAKKAFMATSFEEAVKKAKVEFNIATKYTGNEIGCTCCGRPFYFRESYDDED